MATMNYVMEMFKNSIYLNIIFCFMLISCFDHDTKLNSKIKESYRIFGDSSFVGVEIRLGKGGLKNVELDSILNKLRPKSIVFNMDSLCEGKKYILTATFPSVENMEFIGSYFCLEDSVFQYFPGLKRCFVEFDNPNDVVSNISKQLEFVCIVARTSSVDLSIFSSKRIDHLVITGNDVLITNWMTTDFSGIFTLDISTCQNAHEAIGQNDSLTKAIKEVQLKFPTLRVITKLNRQSFSN